MVRPGSGPVWGGILGGIARVGFSHRESALPDPLNCHITSGYASRYIYKTCPLTLQDLLTYLKKLLKPWIKRGILKKLIQPQKVVPGAARGRAVERRSNQQQSENQ